MAPTPSPSRERSTTNSPMQPSSEQSDTPRTDSEVEALVLENKNHPHTDWVPASFARVLERENTELRALVIMFMHCASTHPQMDGKPVVYGWNPSKLTRAYEASDRMLRAQ